ncbi:hypothetical protein FHS39_002511 [Streptomyces olivoverticillatus]|uniref:Uncharacterized protein n=1 Tax=Streptomyces olivoverticillatus TaxID=66427 RepID=A0A7W7PM61_9ACTN|nr:hypothetical protein [Streptomyces olivoverticillatus]MBB4893480.1 hypothetical protein [Streptomyces olivoverticillatus]
MRVQVLRCAALPYDATLVIVKRPGRHLYYVDERRFSQREADRLQAALNTDDDPGTDKA